MTDDGSPAAPGAPRAERTSSASRPGYGPAARRTAKAPAASTPTADTSTANAAAANGRPLRRPGNLRQASPIAKISMAVFAVGLVAILVEVAMVASGVRSLPLWLNLVALLAPIGLLVGLLNTMIRARRERS